MGIYYLYWINYSLYAFFPINPKIPITIINPIIDIKVIEPTPVNMSLIKSTFFPPLIFLSFYNNS